MKKCLSILLIISTIVSILIIPSYAYETEKDPNYDFHLQVSYHIDGLRKIRDLEIEPIQKKIENFRKESEKLFLQKSDFSVNLQKEYNMILNSIKIAEKEISEIKNNYFNEIDLYLNEIGFEKINDKDFNNEISKEIHTSATDAGNMQTRSSISYNKTTKEFYYFVEYDYGDKNLFGAYTGLNDSWGTYDLVSMQHKDVNAWSWRNIIVTANLAYGVAGNNVAGKADKYKILSSGFYGSPSAVSNRNDFWNGCIFNVRDTDYSGPQNFSSHIRYITLEGWLKTSGTTKTTQVKSEYEHNYAKLLGKVSIGNTNLNNSSFKMDVTYEKSSGKWMRSAGSRNATIS